MASDAFEPDLRAGALLQAGLADAIAARHRPALDAALPGLDPSVRAFGDALLSALGGLAAEVELLRQRLEATERSRAERIQIDPLRFIGAERAAPLPVPPDRAELSPADDAAFVQGWHPSEPGAAPPLRWSGPGAWAALRLPAVAGARLRLTLELRLPSGPGPVLMLLDAVPLTPRWEATGEARWRAVAEAEVPEDGQGTHVLLLHAPQAVGPGGRAVGLGLLGGGLERVG